MDYTNNHENNKYPGNVNYDALIYMYGKSRMLRGDDMKNIDDERIRTLQKELNKYATQFADPFQLSSNRNVNGEVVTAWKIVHKSDTDEIHERRLENGYSIRTSFMLA